MACEKLFFAFRLRIFSTGMSNAKYYLYARKSTDDEDHQIMSIEAQLFALREYAKKEKLEIIAEITEAKSAKIPGREVFGDMMAKIEKSNGIGILAWHSDRLARNSVDGGRVIYLVDTGKIAAMRFPTFWFEPTPQGKFMLNIAFGQSKYYIDNLSENVKRGLREKLRRNIFPGLAPLGYINELRNHTIDPDKRTFNKVKDALEAFATGKYNLYSLRDKMTAEGLTGLRGRPLQISTVQRILTNPFYYGMFMYRGELYHGTHMPMISKKLFDQIQQALADNGKPRKTKIKKQILFRNFAVCGECGYSITAEHKTKKSGKQYVYYRCSYKSTKHECGQHRYLREDDLAQQIKETVQKVSLTDNERDLCLDIVSEWENENRQPSNVFEQSLKTSLADIKSKIDRLGDAYLDNAYELDEYKEKKNLLIEKKKEIEEKLANFRTKGNR
jgi:DNA invertase Pin-like site-specific DNA recombinase